MYRQLGVYAVSSTHQIAIVRLGNAGSFEWQPILWHVSSWIWWSDGAERDHFSPNTLIFTDTLIWTADN